MASEYRFSSIRPNRDVDLERSRDAQKSSRAALLLDATFGYSSRVSATRTSSKMPVLPSSELEEKQPLH